MDNPAISVDKTCTAGRMRLMNRVVTSVCDDVLRPLGRKISRGNGLVVTGKMVVASPRPGLRVLATRLFRSERNVELMRKKGWFEEAPGGAALSHSCGLTLKAKG